MNSPTELCKIALHHGCLKSNLYKKYNNFVHCHHYTRKYHTIFKHMRHEKFNLLENGIIFIENEFPYNCARGITHYVVWISDRYPYNIDKLESFITKSIHEKDPSGEYVFYKNIPQNNSISCVNHYHVFVKFS